MLAIMATVTSGILSPNFNGLNSESVALKFAHHAMDSTPFHHRQFKQSPTNLTTQNAAQLQQTTSTNSSDSEQDAYNCYEANTSSPKHDANNSSLNSPKRNKRKNFKPRCSNSTNAFFEHPVHLGENNNVRRRKTAPPPRKLVVETASYSPMDLSGNITKERDSDASNQSDSFDEFNTQKYRNSDCDDEDDESSDEFNDDSEPRSASNDNNTVIPNSFSIHNLSKSYVSETGVSNKDSYHPQEGAPALSPEQVAEMRSYAMNTMRELLGIYGLTSEVAESISRQLPMAAFSTGKIFENLSLNPQLRKDSTPLSEPPTPPSTPLSPRNVSDIKHNLTNFNIPSLTITQQQSSHNKSSLPQHFPLNLNKRPSETNGLNAAADFGFGGENDATFGRSSEDGGKNNAVGQRGIFPGSNTSLVYSHLNKTDSTSPPPLEPSPLNAMIQQSMSASSIQARDPLTSSNLLINKSTQMDYSKYVKKFSSSLECGSTYCKDLSYREHFHCLDCNSRVFIKKEEMIRHFKWHKKRDESLQHGFLRYSPLDDCSDKFPGCTHNKKQTHYHCIQENCDKVYISTSDVQMHSNYHRKDSAIMQEGFQRYRATEECGASHCAFFGQRTTHFHCRRSGCRFTFKNKSDMEKHKSYHIKDEQLSRDGFKKFMKNEACRFENCRFSRVCNHIHCIRPQCSYVLHSSGQLFSHKRKHERKDSELAYRKYKLAQSMMKTLQDGTGNSLPVPFTNHTLNRDYEAQIDLANFYNNHNATSSISNISNTESLSDRNSPLSYNDESESALAMDLSASETSNFPTTPQEETFNPSYNILSDDFWKKYCHHTSENSNCIRENCEYKYQEHFHCITESCEMVFTSKDGAKEHARNHEQQEIITDNFFTTVASVENADYCDETCVYQNKEKHYHCNIDNCREIILPSDKPFRRLEHYKMHQYSQKLSLTKDPLTATHLATSIDGMFCRKRGRPPKNRVIEVWNDYNPMGGSQSLMDSPQAIFTSFKLPKPSATQSFSKDIEQQEEDDRSSTHSAQNNQDYSLQGFDMYSENTKCPDNLCPFLGASHFHCNQNRCLYATDKEDLLVVHSKDFHENIEILEGFEFYDRNVDCRLADCPSNKTNRHFHCTRPNCHYSFVQYSQMAVHNAKHTEEKETQHALPSIRVKSEELLVEKDKFNEENQFTSAMNLCQSDNKVSVVRASGTFYPISTVPSSTELLRKSPEIKNHFTETSGSILDQSSTGSNTMYGPELSCSRPFCKLKRKFHYHCNACNQAFSELDKLLPHVAKHSSGALSASGVQEDNNNSGSEPESPQNLSKEKESLHQSIAQQQKISVASLHSLQSPQQPEKSQKELETPYFATPTFDAYNHFANFPPSFATQIALMQQQNAFLPQSLYQQGIPSQIMFQHAQLMQNPLLSHHNQSFTGENLTSPLAAMAANLNKRSLSPHDMSPEAKKARIQTSMRILKDEPVPAGYLRFRFNEDCKYQHCGYREHQTHFHCQRHDCGYSFCDKTRFVQHTARHERLDTLMGGDFQQYRANVACGRPDCAYTANLGSTQNKASHFHCLKCEFVCTDTNKVVAHRRQHQKLDSIQAAGFEKFTPSQVCRVPNCQHSGKQTHYHCLQCQYAVLGLAQMSAHKYRHMEG